MDEVKQHQPRLSPIELVQAYKATPLLAIREEIRKRLHFQLYFNDFLENANLFIAADPGNRPVSPSHKVKPPFTWHRAFDQYMEPRAKGGHREDLSAAQWGLLLERDQWYFGGSIQGVQEKILPDLFTELCYENPDCLNGYHGFKDILSQKASDHVEHSRKKAREQFIESVVILDIEVGMSHEVKEVCYWKDPEFWPWPNEDGEELPDYENSEAS